MKPFSPALATLFDTQTFVSADLITITLVLGGVIYLTSADINLTWEGNTYLSGAPRIERSSISQKTGLQVSTVKLTLYPAPTDIIGGISWLSAFRRGMFDGASVTIQRAFAPAWGQAITGTILMMAGRVADSTFGRSKIEVEVNSWTELLSNQMPRTYYQSACNNVFGDTRCGINVAALAVTGVILAVDGPNSILTNLPTPTNILAYGRLAMTSGICDGEQRPISANTGPSGSGNLVTLQIPFSVSPAVGDTITAYPGCDKTQATCEFRYGNVANFTGFPFIPAPETAV